MYITTASCGGGVVLAFIGEKEARCRYITKVRAFCGDCYTNSRVISLFFIDIYWGTYFLLVKRARYSSHPVM